jgi:hypothetical protein
MLAASAMLVGLMLPSPSKATVPRTVVTTSNLAGRYLVRGTEPSGGAEESTTAIITRVSGTRYRMVEAHALGDVYAECLLRRRSLVCAWAHVGVPVSLFVYRKEPGGDVRGEWLDTELDVTGEEIGQVYPGTSPGANIFKVKSGQTSDGTRYSGMHMLQFTDGGLARWTALGFAKPLSRYGRGLMHGAELVVGANSLGNAGVVVYDIGPHTLDGRWMDWSRPGIGTETLTKL